MRKLKYEVCNKVVQIIFESVIKKRDVYDYINCWMRDTASNFSY